MTNQDSEELSNGKRKHSRNSNHTISKKKKEVHADELLSSIPREGRVNSTENDSKICPRYQEETNGISVESNANANEQISSDKEVSISEVLALLSVQQTRVSGQFLGLSSKHSHFSWPHSW